MSSSLTPVLLSFENRTNLFLFLKEKPRTIEEINSELDINSVAILSRLKKLKEGGLVVQEDRIYSLSLTGKILVRRMESLVKAFRLLEDNYDYCPGVKPGGVPPIFFKLMEELMEYMPYCYHGEDASSVHQEVIEAFCSSKQILLIISYPDLRFPGICAEHVKKGLKVSVILTQAIFEKFAEEFKEELDTLLRLENFQIYVLGNDIAPPAVTVTDTMVLTCFLSGKNEESEDNSMVSFGEKAVQWGKELFEHFKALAKPLASEPPDNSYLQDRKSKDPDYKSLSYKYL